MIIDDGLYKTELDKLNSNSINPTNWKYSASFIDENNNNIDTLNVVALKLNSDFIKQISSYVIITLQVSKKAYFSLLSVNRKKLQLKLTYSLTNGLGGDAKSNIQKYQLFDAYLLDNTSEAVEMRSGQLEGNQRDDLGSLQLIHVQLVDRGLNEFRLIEQARVYRNIKLDTLLRGLFSRPVKSLANSGKNNFDVSMVDADNTERYYQLLIGNGVRLVDLPSYIQQKWGVYSAGISIFLHLNRWYIFPPYNIKRYNDETRSLTIINVPKNEMAGNFNSYAYSDKELYIFATGDTTHLDFRDHHLDRVGGGFRTTKAANVLDHFVDTSKGVSKINSESNYMEVFFDDRKQDLYNLTSKERITSNIWHESSKIIKGMHNVIIVTWEYSDHDLITPGMPLKFIYKAQGAAKQLYGIVASIETDIDAPMASTADNRYKSRSVLTLLVEQVSN